MRVFDKLIQCLERHRYALVEPDKKSHDPSLPHALKGSFMAMISGGPAPGTGREAAMRLRRQHPGLDPLKTAKPQTEGS